MMDSEYRKSTDEEQKQIAEAYESDTGVGWTEAGMENRPLIIVEGFATDSPGYAGPIAVVIDGTGGAMTFGFDDDGAFLWRMPKP
jgi:hypothetical protein